MSSPLSTGPVSGPPDTRSRADGGRVSPTEAVRPLSTGDARALGVTPGQLAGPGWSSPTRGVHRPATSAGEPSPRQRILDVAELLPPGAAIGGWAAAHLLGASELDGRGWSGRALQPVPVILPPPMLIRARTGMVRWRSELADDERVDAGGVVCSSAVRTGFDLVRLRDLRSGVVCLDVMGRQLGLSPAAVLAHAAIRRRWRGRPRIAPAVRLADPRALSTGETLLRLEDAGLVVVRASAPDVWPTNRARTVLRLHTARRRGLTRDRARDRWTWVPRRRVD